MGRYYCMAAIGIHSSVLTLRGRDPGDAIAFSRSVWSKMEIQETDSYSQVRLVF